MLLSECRACFCPVGEVFVSEEELRSFVLKQLELHKAILKVVKEYVDEHYSEASASPLAWPLMLRKHFRDADEYNTALVMLQKMLSRNPRNPDEYIVDRERCREAQEADV